MKSSIAVCAAFAALVTIASFALACGGGGLSREGQTVTRYELQEGDCFNTGGPVEEIELTKCSAADRYVLEVIALDVPVFGGNDWAKDQANDLCPGAMDTFFRPSSSTWALGDRLIVCMEKTEPGFTIEYTPLSATATATVARTASTGRVYLPLDGTWNSTEDENYFVLEYLRRHTTDSGTSTDRYHFTEYNTVLFLPIELSDGTILVRDDGRAGLAGSDPELCNDFSGVVEFVQASRFSGTINCNDGGVEGPDIHISFIKE